jgi:RNA polymerase sigma factor for flagellar operon FliA
MSRTVARTARTSPAARTDRASVSAKGNRAAATAVAEPPPPKAAKAAKPVPKAAKPVSKSAPPAKKSPPKPVPLSERPLDQVWREYRTAPTELVRNFLMERYLDLVRYTAERMHMKLPAEVEVDDLMSAGLFGLMDAINAFDPDRGVKFETYCTQRIRGAIFDELRSMDWVPRLVRSRTAKVEKVRKSLEMESGRRPTDVEVAARMKVDAGEFEKLQKDSRPVGLVSLNRKWFETDSSKDVREIDVIKDTRQENPIQLVQRQDLQMLITKGLSRAERLIVILYYYEEMTMKEIGLTLDLSESRVSQMHSSILARLKAQMQHRTKDV